VTARAAVGGIGGVADTRVAALIGEREGAVTRSIHANKVARAGLAAAAAVLRVVGGVHAPPVAQQVLALKADTLATLTRLILVTRVVARTAVLRIVRRNGHPIAHHAVVHAAVAVVIDAIATDLGFRVGLAGANGGRKADRIDATPVGRLRAVGVTLADAGAHAAIGVDADAQLRLTLLSGPTPCPKGCVGCSRAGIGPGQHLRA
jgi:hypothetical protein